MQTQSIEGAGLRIRGSADLADQEAESTAVSGSEGGALAKPRPKPKLDPEFQAEIDKLDATQAKVREAISVQQDALAIKKEALRVIQEQEKDAQGKVDEISVWLQRARQACNNIDRQVQAVHVRFDLKRLRPLVGIAAEKKKKLIMETEKIGSAHKEVSSRVSALEAELEELQAEKSEKGKQGSSGSGSSPESEPSSGSGSASNAKEGTTTVAPSLDAMLADLTS